MKVTTDKKGVKIERGNFKKVFTLEEISVIAKDKQKGFEKLVEKLPMYKNLNSDTKKRLLSEEYKGLVSSEVFKFYAKLEDGRTPVSK